MNGVVALRAVLTADAGLTALVPASRIIGDDVLPQGTALPAILLKQVSGTDLNLPKAASSVFTRKRVQAEIYAADSPTRGAVKNAVRLAGLRNPLPTIAGFGRVTLHTESEGPDFFNEDPFVRIGEQDFIITYSEDIT